jgi:tetratricopeptide (TPR) repeat protein
MGSRSVSPASACLIRRILRGFFISAACITATSAQTTPSPQDLLKEAVTFHQSGQFDRAIEDYRLLLAQYPNMAMVRSDLGAALAAAGRYEEAIAEYQRALQLKPLPEVQLNLGLAYYKAAQLSRAVEAFKKAHSDLPGEPQPVLLLADCYLRLGENKKVIELLDPMEQSKQADAAPDAVTYMLGTALVRDNQAAKGQLLIDKILRNGDSAEARFLLGTTKLSVNDYSGALADLQKAVDLNPNLPDLFAYYGIALLSTGDQESAQAAFARALKDDPNNFDGNLRMGVLLRNDEHFDEALQYFQHALQIRPGDPGVRYQIASLKLAVGQVQQARGELETLVAEAPTFTEAHVSLASAYYREKRKAEGDREKAIVEKLNAERQAREKAVPVKP